MDEGHWRRRVDNWDRFLERWYAPLVVFFGSVALSFSVTLVYVGAFDSVGLTLSLFLSLFLGAANTYTVFARHNQRVGPIPGRL